MSDKIEVALAEPAVLGGKEVRSLRLRRPRVRDLEKMDNRKGGEVSKVIHLVADLAEVSPDEVRDLAPADFQRVNKALMPFLTGGEAEPASAT